MAILQSHIMDHVSIQAREEVEDDNKAEIEQVTAQYGGQLPEQLQLQFQEMIEQQVAEKIAIMTEEMVGEELEMMQALSQDPLVDLKQQEINLRSEDIERKTMNDEAKIGIDEEKLRQDAKIAQDRIDSQEDIAQLRANVNLTKQKEIEKSKKRPRTVDVNKNIRYDN
jgi:methionine-rich copper-binding protein CopC